MRQAYPLRPFLLVDTVALADLFAQSIEELTQDDYNEDQRLAWISGAEDTEAFAARLEDQLTLIVEVEGEILGFASLKDNAHFDMLFVHPYHAGQGVGTALADAIERLAQARGAKELTVDASDTALEFFEGRGYIATQRNLKPVEDQWLSNMTMKKVLGEAKEAAQAPRKAP